MKTTRSKILASIVVLGLILAACSGKNATQEVVPSAPASDSASARERCAIDPAPYSAPHQGQGPAVDRIEFSQHGVDQAVADLRNDKIDFYQFSLKLSAAQQLQNEPSMKAYCAPSGSVSLILNPAPAPSGGLNPFSLPQVRQAMNYLVDREFIANSIYGGLAVPQISHVSKLDYDYLAVANLLTEKGVRYDFDLARSMVTEAMEKAGAELVGGKWNYQGRPIRLKFIIRVEDERREVGDAIRASLESLGFEVVATYQQFAAALATVYSADPQSFGWHLYTEGWGSSSSERYDFSKINQFSAPWMAQMPGWQIFGFWQYQNDRLDKIGQRLFTGDFSNREERDNLYREATELAFDEAVRIWVVTTYNTFPANAALAGVTEDVTSGPKSALTLRESYIPGKNFLRVGSLWVWTERSVWNPVGGFGDVFSADIWKNLVDPALISDPFRGVPVPFRAGFEIKTAGPTGKLVVPGDAVMWNAVEDRWDNVPADTQATSRVTFDFSKYFQSIWHHGRPITMADVLYNLASQFDMVYDPDKQRIEFVLAATAKPLLDVFRGFRVVDGNRLEIYLDYWHFDEPYIASYANIGAPSLPWEVQAASNDLVFARRQAAYSNSSAVRFNVTWLSLAEERNNAALVNRSLRDFARDGYVPKGVFTVNGITYVTSDEAKARYNAAMEWFALYKHLVISNGPFFLARYDPPAQYAELRAFRHDTYPFKPGDWYRARPREVVFGSANVDGSGTVTVELSGPGKLELRYLAVDPRSGEVKASGFAIPVNAKRFTFALGNEITSAFNSGRLEIRLLAVSDDLILVREKVIFR